jgi:phospholipid/cholesterol/gamma-HCH transport system substrate-binding protein
MSKKSQTLETIIGFAVLICAAMFLMFALKSSNIKTASKYSLIAKFDNVEGILIGSDVKISGIKVGSVIGQTIDDITYNAIVEFHVDKSVKLPKDSNIKVSTSGLIGSKFLEIQPGSDEKFLTNNSEIRYTQSTINLEDLISRFVFNSESDEAFE